MASIPIKNAGTSAVNASGPGGAATPIDIKGSNELLLINDGPDDLCYYLDEQGAFVAGGGQDGTTGKYCFLLKNGESTIKTVQILESLFAICDTGNTASLRFEAIYRPYTMEK